MIEQENIPNTRVSMAIDDIYSVNITSIVINTEINDLSTLKIELLREQTWRGKLGHCGEGTSSDVVRAERKTDSVVGVDGACSARWCRLQEDENGFYLS